MTHRSSLMLLALSLLAKSLCAQAPALPAPLTPADRLHGLIAVNSLDNPDTKPWHLKLSVQAVDPKGLATPAGNIEEWWLNPSTHRIVYTTPTLRVEQLANSSGNFISKQIAPNQDLLEFQLAQVVHPMPTELEISHSKVESVKHTFGKLTLDCFSLTTAIKDQPSPPLGLFPAYCFDPGKDSLRLAYQDLFEVVARDVVGGFHGVHVGIDTAVIENGLPVMRAHVDTLTSATFTDADFTTGPDLEKEIGLLKISTDVAGAHKISSNFPVYPEGAKARHMSGSVLLHVIVGRDGRIHRIRIVSTPDAELTIAALKAARSFVYQPYLLNGQAIQMDTTITVNFNFGP